MQNEISQLLSSKFFDVGSGDRGAPSYNPWVSKTGKYNGRQPTVARSFRELADTISVSKLEGEISKRLRSLSEDTGLELSKFRVIIPKVFVEGIEVEFGDVTGVVIQSAGDVEQ